MVELIYLMAHASLWTLWVSGLAWGRLPVFIAQNILGKPGYCALNLLHRLQPGVLLAGILRLRDTRRGSAHTGFQEERGAYEVNDHGLWGYCRPRDGCETERTGAADESGSSHSTASGGGGGSGGLEEVVEEVVMVVVAPLRVGLGLLTDGLRGRAKYKCGGGVLSTRGGASNAHRSGDSRHCNMLTACGRHLVFVNGSRQRKPTD